MLKKLLNVLLIVSIVVFILSFSIAFPIYFRFFYFWQIKPLGLDKMYDIDTIKTAYNEVLNYLTLLSGEFSVGEFRYSVDGMQHFADCKKLFTLNLIALLSSLTISIPLLLLRKKLNICTRGKKSVFFIAGLSLITIFIIVGIIVAIDFQSAFAVFHKIFFPNKKNWLFDPRYDEIINILPMEFFRNCAILIFSNIILLCIICILTVKKKKIKTN